MRKSQTNNTDMGDRIDTIDAMEAYCRLIKENIDYDILIQDEPYNRERLDGFVELRRKDKGDFKRKLHAAVGL